MTEKKTEERCCENCGNTACADSVVAYLWDLCVESNFQKYWRPREDGETKQ